VRLLNLLKWVDGHRLLLAVVLAGVAAGPFAVAGESASATVPAAVRLSRMAPTIPAAAQAIGAAPASTVIDLSVSLAPRDESALTSFIAAASIPGTVQYHQYLDPGQFASRFGPTAATISAVQTELGSLGIGSTTLSTDHLFVNATTTAATMESAFGVRLERYRLPDGTVGYSNATPPLVRGVLASPAVIGILGMDDLTRPRPLLARSAHAIHDRHAASLAPGNAPPPVKAASGPQACAAAATAATDNDSYTDTQIAQAYKLSTLYAAGHSGASQTIALYELEPFSSTDLAAFQKCYGTAVKVTTINEDGGPGTGAGSGESIMDLENIVALAPSAKILVYQAPDTVSDSQSVALYDDMISPDNAKQLSTSWGLCELDEGTSTIRAEYPVFQEAAAYGETVYAAAGDDGSEDCLEDGTANDSKLSVDDPGSDPYVVSVGGLRLSSLTPAESVWNDHTVSDGGDGEGAGGGGISAEWQMPTWQIGTGVINKYSSHTVCAAGTFYYCREVPDVSADADPDVGGWVIYYRGTWQGGNGGTSAAAPLWAALTAVINSGCTSGAVGFDAPRLYEVARNAGNLTDVTSGNNDYTGAHSGDYPATKAYDLASGLGSPIAAGLAGSLC
jgi:subtilase family serine protease